MNYCITRGSISRDEIAGSPDLRRLYAAEYASMLRAFPDRDLAKETARLNVSALAAGKERVVMPGGGLTARDVTQAIARGGGDLERIAAALASGIERGLPAVQRLITGPPREWEPER